MIGLFLQGIWIGIVFGVPAGAIGALTIQRSFKYGFFSGLITGLGSTTADLLYASVSVLGITQIQNFVQQWKSPISLIGGGIVVVMGITVFQKKAEVPLEKAELFKLPGMFFSSFLIAVLNPATILSFLAVFAMLQIETGRVGFNGISLVLGIGMGTVIWWCALSGFATKMRKGMAERVYRTCYKIMGVLLIVFGVVVVINGRM